MKYGFVIDNRRCIGCHACTVACKAEHNIPLGDFRTWVKYVEKGSFPSVRRYFTVMRCNHCEDAPCVNICPTKALYHRPDGIVDFDRDECIGCRSCMAACPYDAIYIEPGAGTAAKCNYCAHRVEKAIEPACVTVCPEQAIVSGDVEDQESRIAKLVQLSTVTVRKPEKGTRPRLSYIEGDVASLTPGVAGRSLTYLWAERPLTDVMDDYSLLYHPGEAVTAYDVSHKKAWGWHISLYLWTKSLASGPALVASGLALLGYAGAPALFGVFTPLAALVMTFITTLLLVGDLERPERFLRLLFRPNLRSWLVWGSYLLISFSIILSFWLAAGILGYPDLIEFLFWPALVVSAMTASYSAFLLAQARGRDLWQSPLLFPHLTIQAFVAGAAMLLLGSLYYESDRGLTLLLARCLLGGLCVHGLLVISEVARPHGSKSVTEAIHYMIFGPLARRFWFGAIFIGVAAPVLLLASYLGEPRLGYAFTTVASVLALIGLLAFEDCYVRAGQALPLS